MSGIKRLVTIISKASRQLWMHNLLSQVPGVVICPPLDEDVSLAPLHIRQAALITQQTNHLNGANLKTHRENLVNTQHSEVLPANHLSYSLQSVWVMLNRYLHIRIIAALVCMCARFFSCTILFLENMGMASGERSFWHRDICSSACHWYSPHGALETKRQAHCVCVCFSRRKGCLL